MKRKVFLIVFALALIIFCNLSYAAEGYNFDINYTGDIVAGKDKNATVILEATDATPYSNVRIKVDFLSGPAKPTILAYDTNGTGYNIMELGYWGPPEGFAVGGTFKNETPVVATYPEAGTYVVQLSLIDVSNGNQVITFKEFTQTVTAVNVPPANNTVENVNNGVNNEIEEIPQTGTSIWLYIGIIAIVVIIYLFIKFRKEWHKK